MYLVALLVGLATLLVPFLLFRGFEGFLLNLGGLRVGVDAAGYALVAVLGIIGCLIAMVYSFKKKEWKRAVFGGILAFVGLHLLFGLTGFISLLRSKKEFAEVRQAAALQAQSGPSSERPQEAIHVSLKTEGAEYKPPPE